MPEPYVPEFNVNHDNSVALNVSLVGVTPGNWAEISGYITQTTGAFIPFSNIQKIPAPVQGASSLTVNVPSTGLDPDEVATVILRVAEVKIWPTVLKIGQAARPEVMQTWVAQQPSASSQQGIQSNQVPANSTQTGQVTVPGGPTGMTVTGGNLQFTLSWAPSASDGGN
jgi:hypothetical protein